MEPFAANTLLICFGGGIVGAAVGGLYAFILCCTLVLAGCLVAMAGGGDFVLLQVGLGPVFGPHIGFTAGLFAVTYAEGFRKNAPGGMGSGKDILSPLMNTSWDVLAVGGVWAVVGHILMQVLPKIPVVNMVDSLALTVVIGGLLPRLLFQREMPWGKTASIKEHGYLGTNGGQIQWVAWQHSQPLRLAVFGLGAGILSASLAWGAKGIMDPMVEKGLATPAAAFVVPLILGWALAGVSLTGLNFATGSIQLFPVWHHIAVMSALAYLQFGSLGIAALVGVGTAFLGDLMARLIYNHGSNHTDPPALAACVGTFLLALVKQFVT